MKNLNELINVVLAEAKRQEGQRKEYLSLVHGLIEGTERKESEITWRISFRWRSDREGNEEICFYQNISERNNGLSGYDTKELKEAGKEIDKCINYLFDCGEETVDAFIAHLSKVAIPQFLQGRYPQDYKIQ